MSPSRRKILTALGWATAGVTVIAAGAYPLVPALPYRKAPTAADAAAWLSLRPDGTIELVMPRAEIGQGIAIAFRQIVAEETGFPLDRIIARPPSTDRLPPVRATVGSDSIKDFGPLVAQAAAALAIALKASGVVDSKPPAGGWALLAARSRLVEAGGIAAATSRTFDRNITRTVIGKPAPTNDIRAIVTGNASLFADDMRLPGMVFATLLPAPRLGATLATVDDTPAKAILGFLGTHRLDGKLYAAAVSRPALERVVTALKPTWTGGTTTQADIDRAINMDAGLSRGTLEHTIAKGDIAPDQRFDIDLRLDVPMAAHACMEPRTAIAQFDDTGALTIWTGTQDVTFVRASLAKALGLSANRVTVHGCRVGGAFGGKTIVAHEHHAAQLARTLGQPVKLQWTREAEFREAFHRPPSSHRIRASLTSDGRIGIWHHAFRSGHVIFTSAAMGPALQFATSLIGDPGVLRGARPPYSIAHEHIEFEDVRLPIHTGPWRGLGAAPNIWAIETAIDALARHRNEDPLAFRRRMIAPTNGRLVRCLERVAAQANWPFLKSTPALGYGIACGIYKEMSYAAVIAEVERRGATIGVSRLWCAHDCGQIINPDQVRAQVEGNLVWGLGMALHEELGIRDGHIASTSFATYAVPRFSDIPAMTIDLVDDGASPSGAGETAIVAATAAITNAIAAVTGKTVTRLPWRAAA